MKIGIVSDTHGSAVAWETAIKFFGDCKLIIHAGDILYHGPRNLLPEGYNPQRLAELINSTDVPVIFARGNCDADIDSVLLRYPVQAPYSFLYIEGKQVLVTHGTDLDNQARYSLAQKFRSDMFISGHTHTPELEKINGTIFLNPGSCALPKNSEGATAALWEEHKISILTLKEGKTIKEINI